MYVAHHHKRTTDPAAFIMLPNCSRDVILGMDFVIENGAIIDLPVTSISLSADCAVMPKPSTEQRTSLRVADAHVTLHPRASVMAAVYCQDDASGTEAIVESDQSSFLERGASFAYGIVRLKQGKSHVLTRNVTEGYQHMNKGASIAFLEEIQGENYMIAFADFQRTFHAS